MIDLSRPPIRPGPRVPGWILFTVTLGASSAVLALVFLLEGQRSAAQTGSLPPGARVVLFGLVLAGWAALLIFWYAALRLAPGSGLASNLWRARGHPVGDPDRTRRLSDLEERVAWKRFQRGEITRVEYERLMAGRRFAHGEISTEEYHGILRQLTSASADRRTTTGDRST